MTNAWTLKDKVCLITGATLGLGRVTARELARLGPTLILVARDAERGAQLVDELKSSSGNQNIELLIANLSTLADIRRIAAEFKSRHQRLHVLLNNAGAIFKDRQISADGYEMTFALNHLGYFLLTQLLLDVLQATADADADGGHEARIINVSSRAHLRVKSLDFDDLMSERRYSGLPVYSKSKLANILFTYELARRLAAAGKNGPGVVTANCLHPGLVATGFGHNNSESKLFSLAMKFVKPFSLTAEEGAKTLIYLASSPAVSGVSGKYFYKCRETPSSPASHDAAAARRLWEISEQLVRI